MNLVQQNIAVLNDSKVYLEQMPIESFSQKIELLSGSTIGQHTRHFIEFYQCLLNQACMCNIDYDSRQRNLLIESDPKVAIQAIDEVVEKLKTLELSTETIVTTCNSSDVEIKSTIGRELLYNLEHCTHHLALIKVGLKTVTPQIELPKHFGFAPSTILHKKSVSNKA